MAQDTTRRALIGSAGMVAAIAATGAAALASEPQDATTNPDYEAGFLAGCEEVRLAVAAAWLRGWTERGGSVIRHHDGSFVVGWFEYWESPQHQADLERYGGTIPDHAIPMLVHEYDGAMREWHELREAIPGLKEALRTIVTNNPAMGLPRQTEVRA